VDAASGVWKAPANETLRGVNGPSLNVNSSAQSRLDPLGINCLRDFPDRGFRIWGARTLDNSQPEWKYVNVRRFFLYIEQSIDRGTQWVVFEPNDESTWQRVRQAINTFLYGLWRAGALMGTKPDQAFFVKCDRTTMTPDDIQNGRLVAVIGLAIVRPAEFVILKFSQKAGAASP
jgi:phage tail sheath protein FI